MESHQSLTDISNIIDDETMATYSVYAANTFMSLMNE